MYRNNGRVPTRNKAMSFKKWLSVLIILLIPGINVFAALIWGLGGGKNRTRTNFVRALLVVLVLVAAIVAVLYYVGVFDIIKEKLSTIINFA